MVLMPVCQDDRPDAALVLYQPGHVGYDDIHAVHFLIRKAQATVHHQEVFPVFEYGEILSDLIKPSQPG